jgi:hypothetical protein
MCHDRDCPIFQVSYAGTIATPAAAARRVRHRLLPKANGIALPMRGTPRRSSSDCVFVRWLAILGFPLELAGQRQWGGPLVASENRRFDQM